MPNAGTDARSLPDEVLEVLRLRAIRARELGYAVEDIATILVSALLNHTPRTRPNRHPGPEWRPPG